MISEVLFVYSIGQIAKLSNLSTHTIRAWERRYEVVEPVRSSGGTRRYTEEHLRRLQILKAAVEAGNRIGDIAALSDELIADMSGYSSPGMGSGRKHEDNAPELDQRALNEIIVAAVGLDSMALERALNVQYRVLGPTHFRSMLCPRLLTQIGILWERGDLPIAAEHLVSSVLKKLLLRAFDAHYPRACAPKVVFTTPDEEQHELGLLIAAGIAWDAGAEVINLGTQMPADAVAIAVEKVKPAAVALSSIHVSSGAQRAYLGRLRHMLDPQVEIWLGGSQAVQGVDGCHVLDLDQMVQRIEVWSGETG